MKRLNSIKKSLLAKTSTLNKKRALTSKKIFAFIQRKPFTSFFIVLGVFLVLMILGNALFSPKVSDQETVIAPKTVSVYKLGAAPQVSYQGKVEKSGVIKVVAQMPGIVSNINVFEGQEVGRGTTLISLSSNYQGGNALSISRQIAQTQYQNAKDTYDTQKETIGKQIELANKNRENTDLMREIANQSATDTRALVDLNRTIVDGLAANVKIQENLNNTAGILQAKQALSAYQSALTQLTSSLSNLELQANEDNPQAQIAALSSDIAVKQLAIQEKALKMSLEISRLQYNLALVSEANMYPASPFAATVDKVFVKVGQSVNPGTQLVSLSGSNQHVDIVVSVPENIAKNVSLIEPSVLTIGKETIEMMPSYVSTDATNGVLYSVIYQLDDAMSSKLTDATFVNVNIPIGTGDTTNAVPFIPLDSVVQTQEEAFVFIVDEANVARVRKVTLGQIQGRFVEVVSGLSSESQVIVNRNVIEGDKVSVER